ncbi:MAG TPA: methyltransferase domain-containing protein [Actinomycetales bacterium]
MAEQHRRPRRGDVAHAPRTAAVWEVVHRVATDLAAERDQPLHVLDVGGGTGGMAVPLAGLGHRVTVLDPSPDALASLARRAAESGVEHLVEAVQADAATLADVVPADSVDLVCCHGVLEYVDDPAAALATVAQVVRPGGTVSLLVAQRSAAVVARALAGRFAEAAHALDDPDGRWGRADPLPRRYDESGVVPLLTRVGLQVQQVHGVRLFSDLVPEALVDGDDARAALLDLERRAADHPGLASLATQLHLVAGRPR